MLQIISGKFYKSSDRHIIKGKGILYSNFSWIKPIETCVAILEPVEVYSSSVSSFIVSYTNQIPKSTNIIKIGDSEILDQFRSICIFALDSYFDFEKTNVQIMCRDKSRIFNKLYGLSDIEPNSFKEINAGNESSVNRFTGFTNHLIGLPRSKYEIIINCLKNIVYSLQALAYNFDLAYSLLVFCLESLSQNFDKYIPVWEDYDANVKEKLEENFAYIDTQIASRIQSILIKSTFLKTGKRFEHFINEYIDDSFFIEEAKLIINPLRKSELAQVIKNTYTLRSKFAHKLKHSLIQLKTSGFSSHEVIRWEDKKGVEEPYLTYSGLLRLAKHVIYNFVMKQDTVINEDYDWHNNLPGVVEAKLAPEYWIGNHENFDLSAVKKIFTGFLEHLQSAIVSKGNMVNMTKVLEELEKKMEMADTTTKLRMLTIYYLYKIIVNTNFENFENFMDKYESLFNNCTIEAIIVYVITNQQIPWTPEEYERVLNEYLNARFKPRGFLIPKYFYTSVLIVLANMYLHNLNRDKFKSLIQQAIFEMSGNSGIQNVLKAYLNQEEKIEYMDVILGVKPQSDNMY